MLRNNRKLISHFQQQYSYSLNPFRLRFIDNPVYNHLLYQHNHVIKKENNVLNELLDVLHLRETQLTCVTPSKTSIQEELQKRINLIKNHAEKIQPSVTNITDNELRSNSEFFNVVFNENKVDTVNLTELAEEELGHDIVEPITETNRMLEIKNGFKNLSLYDQRNLVASNYADSDAKIKIERFNKDVRNFVDVCCQCPTKIKYAIEFLEDTVNSQVNDVEIFNRLMFALANKGNLKMIGWCFEKMTEASISPNLDSYVAKMDALGWCKENKINSFNQSTAMQTVVDAQKSNLNLLDASMFIKYSSEQMKRITDAMNLVYPDFKFTEPEDLSYNNSLITTLKSKNFDQIHTTPSVHSLELHHKPVMLKQFKEQIDLEMKLSIEVPSIFKVPNSESENQEALKAKIMKRFRDRIAKNFTKHIENLKPKDNFLRPFLTIMDKSVYVDLLLNVVEYLAQTSRYFSTDFGEINQTIGSHLEKRFHVFCTENSRDIEKLTTAYSEYLDFKIAKSKGSTEFGIRSHREEWMRILRKHDAFLNNQNEPWSYTVKLQLGKFLFENIILTSCFLPKTSKNRKEENAFYKIYRTTGYYDDPQLKVHPTLTKVANSTLIFDSNRLPMVASPLPWHSPLRGGYYLSTSKLLRVGDMHHEQLDLIDQRHPSKMYPIYDSLNVLSSCPWRINTPVLDMIIKIFQNNGNDELEIPKPAEFGPTVDPVDKSDIEAFKKYMKKKKEAQKVRAEMHSSWCTELYRLSIANMYRDKIIYFPHSLDFRGRTYPIPPHFNHLGSDLARSIIILAEGKMLGKSGLDMLKIHCINLTGTMKKCTLQERLDHANSIIDEIIDSAKNPFREGAWWKMSEEKWQTLACCIEIANALKCKDPEKFVSQFPIHQDGSCNGLQHYAALGRDLEGAKSVNLMSSEKPSDVYSTVLDIVEFKRAHDEQEINEDSEIAKLLKGYMFRKVIKQTVMTTVYNVTYYGARQQIKSKLMTYPSMPQAEIENASKYLALKTFESIQQLFTAAQKIQNWLSECAYLISLVRNKSVKWDTPLGLPVTQPYFKKLTTKDKMNNKVSRTQIYINQPNVIKQRNAFPPNYVHSLDSSHMMLTSLYCEQAGVQFVSVHDCFWTHACHADIMNKICREQFVALHSLPLLESLSEFFIENYGFSEEEIESQADLKIKKSMKDFNKVLRNVPGKGTFDLENVKDSVYFFS